MGEKNQVTVREQKKGATTDAPQKHSYRELTANLSPVDRIFHLQRAIGNQAVQRLLTSGIIQTKPEISDSNHGNSASELVQRQEMPRSLVKRAVLKPGEKPTILNAQLGDLGEKAKALFAADRKKAHIVIAYISSSASPRFLGPKEPGPDDPRLAELSPTLNFFGIPPAQITILSPPGNLDKLSTNIAIDLYNDINLEPNPDYITSGSLSPSAASPALTSPPPATQPGTGGLPSLGGLFTFKFKAGPVEFNIELPKAATIRLPASLTASKSLTFEIKAESSGTFSAAIILDEVIPYFKVSIQAGVSVSADKGTTGTAGIVFELSQKKYYAENPELLKEAIKASGEKLKKAGAAWQVATDSEERLKKTFDIVGPLGEMYDAIEKSKAAAKPVTDLTITLGAKYILKPGPDTYSETDRTKWPANYLGLTVGGRF